MRVALAATLALLASGIGALVAPTPVQAAYTTSAVSFTGLGCSGNNTVSNWGTATAPANAVSVTFTIIGGGGSGGDNEGGQGGQGGRGAVVTATVPILEGEILAGRIGCGGIDGGGNAAGFTTGPNRSNLSGGGGGSSAICIGTNCAGGIGTIVAIAGGGGGGSRGSGAGTCTDKVGGHGGDAGYNGETTSGGGQAYQGFGGGNGNGTPQAFGGGAGYVNGGGGGGGQGAGAAGGNSSGPVPASGSGNGGMGNQGKDDTQAGSGGGGYAGGGGGGGGEDGACIGGSWASGGGGGGGSSWLRSNTTSRAVSTAGPRTSCGANATGGANAGAGANQGSQTWGCGGNVTATWTLGTPPTGAGKTTGNATKGVGLSISLDNADAETARSCELVGTPQKGTVVLSGGSPSTGCTATYTAHANTQDNGSFQYRVRDSDNLVSPTYTITVPILNRAPTGAAKPVNASRQSSFAIGALTATDLDLDSPLTCSVVTAPAKGTLSGFSCAGSTYTVTAGQFGSDSFTYKVTDEHNGQSPAYTVSISGIANGVPTATAQSVTVPAGGPTAITLAGTDPDGDVPLTCATSGTLTKGGLTGTGCSRTYTSNAGTANAGVGGSESFGFTVTDTQGATSSSATVNVTIANPDLSLTKSHTGRFNEGIGTGTYTLAVANSATAPANGTTTLVDTLPAGMVFRSANVGSSGFVCSATPGVSTT
ncbi:MAG TPA: Ig-like domain-containing protein, partial [Iamia sp.]